MTSWNFTYFSYILTKNMVELNAQLKIVVGLYQTFTLQVSGKLATSLSRLKVSDNPTTVVGGHVLNLDLFLGDGSLIITHYNTSWQNPASIDIQWVAAIECQCWQNSARIWQKITKYRKTRMAWSRMLQKLKCIWILSGNNSFLQFYWPSIEPRSLAQESGMLTITLKCLLCLCETVYGSQFMHE